MSNFWLEDIEAFSIILKTLNERLDLDADDPESAATIGVEHKGRDLHITITGNEFSNGKSPYNDGKRMEFNFDFNMDYQSVDEVTYSLKKMLGLNDV